MQAKWNSGLKLHSIELFEGPKLKGKTIVILQSCNKQIQNKWVVM